MYVCMSENVYPARLKQTSHSRAAVSNKQKRLQCQFEPFSGQVGWAQRGRETVPDPGSSDSETPCFVRFSCSSKPFCFSHRVINFESQGTGRPGERGRNNGNKSMIKISSRRIDAFDQWYLRLRIQYICHVATDANHRSLLSTRRDRYDYLATSLEADTSQDHSRALRAAINRLPGSQQTGAAD